MDTPMLRIFQQQVALQCKFLLGAARDVNTAMGDANPERLFYALQNLLNAGANVSKLLWGSKGRRADARKRLRESIGISDDSPLREVTMRNNFEHLDERLDAWWLKSTRHNYIDLLVGRPILGTEDIDKFRHFDPYTCDLVFWGEKFNLQTLVDEAARILPKLLEEESKPPWDQDPPRQEAKASGTAPDAATSPKPRNAPRD